MDFEDHDDIEIRYVEANDFATDLWGPFSFAFVDKLAEGDEISAITVKAFYNPNSVKQKLKPKVDEASFSTITNLVVDPTYPPTIQADDDGDNTVVYAKFQHPGIVYKSLGIKATLVFEITTTAAAKKPFYFHSLVIE